jgi:hypothetical protein
MPTTRSLYQEIRKQAEVAIRKLRTDIRDREANLAVLREDEQKLQSFVGELSAGKRAEGASTARPSRHRFDWNATLSKLPKQFNTADVRKVRGLADTPSSNIFAAINRWTAANLVKRKERGVYERVE